VRKLYTCGIVVVILLGLFTAGLWFRTTYQRNQAEALLKDVDSLELGTATFSEAQQIAGKYGGLAVPSQQGSYCTAQDCTFTFLFENKFLSGLNRRRRVSFTVGLMIENGKVVGKEVTYGLTTKSAVLFAYILFDRIHSRLSHQEITRNWDAHGGLRRLQVDLVPSTAADLRRRAYSIDLSCLAILRGCDTPNTIFPSGLNNSETDGNLPTNQNIDWEGSH
jgi:hypothetical protein